MSLAPVLPAQALTNPALEGAAPPQATPAFDALLKVGAARRPAVAGAAAWAPVEGGQVTGALLEGEVLPGRVEWRVSGDGGALEITARFAVRRADGTCVQVQDHAVHPEASSPADVAGGICTSPELVEAGDGVPPALHLLVGRLDASGFGAGQVALRVFRIV